MNKSLPRHGSLLQDTAPSRDATPRRRLTVFSGFVSYEQLEQKLLGGQAKGLPWMPKNVEGPHPVRMRGPGSSCAVSCCDVLCYVVPCCDVLCCAVLHCKLPNMHSQADDNLLWWQAQKHSHAVGIM